MRDWRRRLVALLGFILGIGFLVIALRGTNLGEILAVLKTADYALVAPFLLVLAVLYWVRSVRWSVLLGPLHGAITARDVFPAVMIGFASSSVLPPPLGEFVRMYIVGRQLRLKNMAVLATIVLERFFDFLTIVLLVGLALIASPSPTPELAAIGYVVAVLAIVVVGFAAAYVKWTASFLGFFRRLFSLFPDRIEAILISHTDLLASGVMALKSSRRIAVVASLSIAQWGLMTLGIFLSMVSVGIRTDLSAAFVVLAFTFVGVTLPSTPGAVGTIELSFALALAPYGVPSGAAVAASVFWHVIAYCFVLSLGFIFFVRMGFTVGEIRRHAQGDFSADPP